MLLIGGGGGGGGGGEGRVNESSVLSYPSFCSNVLSQVDV